MNIEKIFNVLKEDEQNSALGIVTSELQNQGYAVLIDGIEINSDETEENYFFDFERSSNKFKIDFISGNKLEQSFMIEFVDFHPIR